MCLNPISFFRTFFLVSQGRSRLGPRRTPRKRQRHSPLIDITYTIVTTMDSGTPNALSVGSPMTLIAKYGKQKVNLPNLPSTSTTIRNIKEMLYTVTGILPKRQKLIGLTMSGGGKVDDETLLSELKVKGSKNAPEIVIQFILMGTPEAEIFVDPSEKEDLPDVVDDFDLDFNAGSEEWIQHKAKEDNLQKFTENTETHIINPPRDNKPLLVLDLDHTLLDFSSRTLRNDSQSALTVGTDVDSVANQLKRPYMASNFIFIIISASQY